MAKQDKKTPKEASGIFHNIMKASVTPVQNKTNDNKEIMTRKYEYKSYQYWVTVESTLNNSTKETSFIAYVNNQKPKELYGSPVKDGNGNVMLFETVLSAFTNANAVKQSEIDSKV